MAAEPKIQVLHCLAPDGKVRGGGAPLCAPESFRLRSGLTEDPRLVTCPKCIEQLCEMTQYHNLLLKKAREAEHG